MDDLERAIGDLVIANRILAKEDVVDAYGHVSIRHPQKPDHYLLSRSLSPEFVTRDGHHRVHGSTARRSSDTRPAYLERFIHGAIYEARPDINAVVHSHAEDILPFSISKTPMCCVAHVASDMGAHVPVWDIADKFGDETNLLVINMEQGRDMARVLGGNAVVLMRGHGFSAAADGLLKLVRMAVYLPRNARILLAAMRMGEFKAHVRGRDQNPQPVPRRLAGNAARLGVLGAPRRLRRHAGLQQGRGLRMAGRIDVHFHLIPQFYADVVYAAGSGPAIGRYPDWSPELALEIMDRFGIATALTVARPARRAVLQAGRGQGAGAALQRLFGGAERQAWQTLRRVRHGVDVGRAPRGRRDRLLPRHAEILRRQPVREL